MKTGLTISVIGHASLLVWGLVSFSARPLDAAPKDALPVDIISSKEFSELTKGVKNAPKAEIPKPLVDKVGDPKLAPELTPKMADKPEIKTASAEPPAPEPKPVEAKPDKKPPPKVDAIAEALKKEEAKKKAEAKAKAEQQKQMQQPKFDANQIAALLDKRNPQRIASTDSAISTTPSLGVPNATALKLSQNELDAMRVRLIELWNLPAGVQNPEEWVVRVRIQLGRDRRLAAPPVVLGGGRSPVFETARDSALRAIYRGQPYDMLTPANYEIWKDVEIIFDPREMVPG